MTSYRDAGVDLEAGDSASAKAYEHAASTFGERKGRIGEPVFEEGGYAGMLDMGDYYLVQTDDSTGTKIDLATAMGVFDTLGADLLAMVADDAVCTGAEVISVSNCLDLPKVEAEQVDQLLAGLAEACRTQRIVIPAGEIAEVPGAVSRGVWSATAVGVVEKDKVLQPKTITEGDAVIALRSAVARSNGFSLIRRILQEQYGDEWHAKEWRDGTSWGDVFLTPSVVYHDAVLRLTGRYGEERAVQVKGAAHITGGGIPSKFRRILKPSGCGARLDALWEPHEALTELIELGGVATQEAYRTWNMGTGMLLVVPEAEQQYALDLLQRAGVDARRAGTITADGALRITAYDGTEIVA